jgi:hypothetical protein
MSISSQDIYRSANGDVWKLITDAESRWMIVRHVANKASGGQVTDTDVLAFLSVNGAGPEYAALRDILRKMGMNNPSTPRTVE